jgi:hypothetical protein
VVVGATVVLVVDVVVVGAGVGAVVEVGVAAFEPPLHAAASIAATPATVTRGVLRNITF